jgi:predicted metalloprotease with PDZ domain
VFRQRAQLRQTVTEAGLYAWTKYYQPTENSPNANVNYYVKGALIALCIDLFIRHNSRDHFSLDDVMRQLWHNFGRDFYETGAPRGVILADIQTAIERYAGGSAQDLLYVALFSTQTLPLNLLLLTQGLHLKYSPPKTAQLGATLKKTGEGWLVERVLSDSMAERANLSPQDILIAMNRFKLDKNPDDLFAQYARNAAIPLAFWRDGVLHNTQVRNRIVPSQIGHFKLETAPRTFKLTAWPKALPVA